MTVEQLQKQYNFCDKHRKTTDSGYYGRCLHCSCEELSKALSEIDLLLNPIGDAEYGYFSEFDLHYNPKLVVERVRRRIIYGVQSD